MLAAASSMSRFAPPSQIFGVDGVSRPFVSTAATNPSSRCWSLRRRPLSSTFRAPSCAATPPGIVSSASGVEEDEAVREDSKSSDESRQLRVQSFLSLRSWAIRFMISSDSWLWVLLNSWSTPIDPLVASPQHRLPPLRSSAPFRSQCFLRRRWPEAVRRSQYIMLPTLVAVDWWSLGIAQVVKKELIQPKIMPLTS